MTSRPKTKNSDEEQRFSFNQDDANDEHDTLIFIPHQELQKVQDERLDAIENSLGRVGKIAEGFHAELRLQNDMLDGIGVEIEKTHISVKSVEQRTAELIEKSGGPRWFCLILVLGAIAFLLFLLIIYT